MLKRLSSVLKPGYSGKLNHGCSSPKQFQSFGSTPWSGLAIAIAATSIGLIAPMAQAQTAHLQTLHTTIQQAVCQSDWNRAIQSVNQILSTAEIPPDYRESMVVFRQQLQTYQSTGVRVDPRQHPHCAATSPATPSASQTGTSPARPMNWDRAAASLSGRATGQMVSNRGQQISAGTACPEVRGGDRRVSSGTISNRWAYETYETRNGFYIRYWEQHDCRSMSRFPGTYESQNAVRDAFVDYINGRRARPMR